MSPHAIGPLCARAALVFALALLLWSGPLAGSVRADRPTSGDMSLLSGRTLGGGKTVLAAGLGWPGFWAEAMFSPSSTLDIAVRGSVLIGSPVMGFGGAVGGGVSVPIRLHLLGKGTLDIAGFAEPRVFLGQGSLAGQTTAFATHFGYGVGSTLGAVAGAQVTEAVTLIFGLGGDVLFVSVPDTNRGGDLVGTGIAFLGIEALMSRDTLLFAEVRGGIGFSPDALFTGPEVLRVSLGVAYEL